MDLNKRKLNAMYYLAKVRPKKYRILHLGETICLQEWYDPWCIGLPQWNTTEEVELKLRKKDPFG